jgi:hypothetical protein
MTRPVELTDSKNKDVQNVVRQASRLLWPGLWSGGYGKYLLTTQTLVPKGQKQKKGVSRPCPCGERKHNSANKQRLHNSISVVDLYLWRLTLLIFPLLFRGKATVLRTSNPFHLTILPCFDPDRRQIADTPERGNFYVLFQSVRSF